MAFKLSPEAQAQAAELQRWHDEAKRKFASLTDENLAATCELYMAHAEPRHWAPGAPVYDATLWHVILPELLNRIRR